MRMKLYRMPKWLTCLVLAAMVETCLSSLALAQEDETKAIRREQTGQVQLSDQTAPRMAILIGVQDYYSLPKLKYCNRDVDLLATTLEQNCGFTRVVKLTDDAKLRRYQPSRGNIIRELQTWLEVANDGGYSQVLVYFTGHGFVGKRGNLYFAPPSGDVKSLDLTGLPLSFVRDRLQACDKVPIKMLVLDTCHSGEDKGDADGVTGDDVKELFGDVRGLLTLSSCKADQVSVEWDAKRQGLFTYWLCEGLSGKADRDRHGESGHGEIDHLELYRYVQRQVLETSADLGRLQHVRQQESEDWQGIAVLARVSPQDRGRDSDTSPSNLAPPIRPPEIASNSAGNSTAARRPSGNSTSRNMPIIEDLEHPMDLQQLMEDRERQPKVDLDEQLNLFGNRGGSDLPYGLTEMNEDAAAFLGLASPVDCVVTNLASNERAIAYIRCPIEKKNLQIASRGKKSLYVPQGKIEYYDGIDWVLVTGLQRESAVMQLELYTVTTESKPRWRHRVKSATTPTSPPDSSAAPNMIGD